MSFTIKCNKCGNEIIVIDGYKAKNDKIPIYTNISQYGTTKEYIEKMLWCEKCDNNTEFEE